MTTPNKERLLHDLAQAKGEKDDAEFAYNHLRSTVQEAMEADGEVSWSSPAGTATIVTGSQSVLDEPGLLEKLEPHQLAAVTITKVDNKRLEAAVELGLIDAELVAKFISEVPKKPYLRFSSKS